MSDAAAISPDELGDLLASEVEFSVLDVRDRDEYEEWRIEGPGVTSKQVPHVQFLQAQVDGDPTNHVEGLAEPIVVVCGRGAASGEVAEQLRKHGVDARNLADGMAGWARVYRIRELGPSLSAADTDSSQQPAIAAADAADAVSGCATDATTHATNDAVTVLQCDRPASGCLAHVVISGDEAVVIDPLRSFADQYADIVADHGAALTGVVDTHVHADHVSGLRAVAKTTGAAQYLPSGAADRGLEFEASLLSDGDSIAVGDHELRAVHAPGHTSEMTALRLSTAGRELLFGGDLLFQHSVARPDLEAGAEGTRELARDLQATLRNRIFALPAETLVLPGHRAVGERPDVGDIFGVIVGDARERITVEADPDAFADRILSNLPERPTNYDEIVETNLGRKELDESAAFEVELGPNNCAASGN
ncbi:MBL fold metallo-hydrolase [Haloparvum sp. AD34]